MTVKAQVFVTGDARLVPGCHGRYDVVTAAPAGAEARARRAAAEPLWQREPVDGGPPGAFRDVCAGAGDESLLAISAATEGPPAY
jgi:hypothetical protein